MLGHALEFGEIEVQAGGLQNHLMAVDRLCEVSLGLAFESAGINRDRARDGMLLDRDAVLIVGVAVDHVEYLVVFPYVATVDADDAVVGALPGSSAPELPVSYAESDKVVFVALDEVGSDFKVLALWIENDHLCEGPALVDSVRGVLPVEGRGVDPGRFDGRR